MATDAGATDTDTCSVADGKAQTRPAVAGVFTCPKAVLNCPPVAAGPGVIVFVTAAPVQLATALAGQRTGTVTAQLAGTPTAPLARLPPVSDSVVLPAAPVTVPPQVLAVGAPASSSGAGKASTKRTSLMAEGGLVRLVTVTVRSVTSPG